eukprot:490266_1
MDFVERKEEYFEQHYEVDRDFDLLSMEIKQETPDGTDKGDYATPGRLSENSNGALYLPPEEVEPEDIFVLDPSVNNDNAKIDGIKHISLKYTYHPVSDNPYPDSQRRWEVINSDTSPADGTFMLLKRSSLHQNRFMSLAFFSDFSKTQQKIKKCEKLINESHAEGQSKVYMMKQQHIVLHEKLKRLKLSYHDALVQLLMDGIQVVNSNCDGHYRFAGHSNSQLRQTSCYMVRADSDEMQAYLNSIGKFDRLQDIAKLVKCIGLLFSTVKSPIMIGFHEWEEIDDVENESFCFTDGCGTVPTRIMRRVMDELKLSPDLETISAIQIRFRGYKGMLVHDPTSDRIRFSRSMRKFVDDSPGLSPLGICDWSTPFRPGYLIMHYVMLLSTLGVPDKVFLALQEDYHNSLRKMLVDPEVAFKFLRTRKPDIAEMLLSQGLTKEVLVSLRSARREEVYRLAKSGRQRGGKLSADTERVRIFVSNSRNVHGVHDASKKLSYGEVYYAPTLENGVASPLRGDIVVARTPCYYPGDVRVLRCVDPGPAYHHLRDVIVFPVDTEGGRRRPHPDEMSGGDLDGDLFWVCWNPDLIPPRTEEPFVYEPPDPYAEVKTPTEQLMQRIEYFSDHDPAILGIIDSVYFEYANRFTPNCRECRLINGIFAKTVDGCQEGKKQIFQLRKAVPHVSIKNFIWLQVQKKNRFLHQ